MGKKHQYQLVMSTTEVEEELNIDSETGEIIINTESKSEYLYKFKETKIKLVIAENIISISMSMEHKKAENVKTHEGMLHSSDNEFSDAIKHAFLLYVIKYSKHIQIKQAIARIDEEKKTIFLHENNNTFPIHSLINGSLVNGHEFPEKWRESKISQVLLARRKSNYNSLDSALSALIYAKSKENETDRFVYLWIAMNGMYQHFFNIAKPLKVFKVLKTFTVHKGNEINNTIKINDPPECLNNPSEKLKMLLFSAFYNLGTERVNKKESITNILKNCENNITEDDLFHISEELKGHDITPRGYLLLNLAYHYRCNFFHANKKIHIFSYQIEESIKCLCIINNIIEEFVEEELFKWFKDDFVATVKEKDGIYISISEKDITDIKSDIRCLIKKRFEEEYEIEKYIKKTGTENKNSKEEITFKIRRKNDK